MPQANIQTWETTLAGETLLFGLLSKAIYEDPDKDWLETLIREDVFADVPFGEEQTETVNGLATLQAWSAKNRAGIPEAELKALKADQLHLFIGTDEVLAPVWESVYFSESRLVFQEQTMQVREWFARYGLQIEKLNHEPDDHIGLELSFVAHLASEALEAFGRGDDENFKRLLQAMRDFLSEHLLRWGPSWARKVKKHATTDYYRGLAQLTHGALLAAAEYLGVELPKEVSF